ncbi:DUF3017 domain-containing protein [Streptomyces sp. NPDC087440]|uniref:DUF3017 domain-containing protein n=1 Tax=Streptomyces sp. NPDC087440 TaxID=3365790 RepID=UPI00380DC365
MGGQADDHNEPNGKAAPAGTARPEDEATGPAGSEPEPAETGTTAGTGPGEPGEPAAKGVVSAPGPEGPVRTTRRFPLLTRDTARPEGGGRAADGDAPAPVRQWPLITVLGLTGIGLLLVAVDAFDMGFRLGTVLIGVALVTGAVFRWVLPSVGMLAVRSRFTDIVTYGLLGVVIMLLAMMTQPDPWLKVPILEEAVRFTVR